MPYAKVITFWHGSIASIPTCWAYCDGNNGTPDLRDRFVNCLGDAYGLDFTGGSQDHKHTFTANPHFHGILGGGAISRSGNFQRETDNTEPTGETSDDVRLPPYKSLVPIMYTG